MGHHLGLATRTQISVCKSPFSLLFATVSLFRAKMVQQRPLLLREVKTRLLDCGVTHQVRIDHLSRLPVMPPSSLISTGCMSSHSGLLDVSGLRISGWIRQLSCLTIFSTILSVAAFLHRAGGSVLKRTGSRLSESQRGPLGRQLSGPFHIPFPFPSPFLLCLPLPSPPHPLRSGPLKSGGPGLSRSGNFFETQIAVGDIWCILGELMMTYNRAILGTESFKKWSHCDGYLVESPVTVRVMILLIPRKVIKL